MHPMDPFLTSLAPCRTFLLGASCFNSTHSFCLSAFHSFHFIRSLLAYTGSLITIATLTAGTNLPT